MARFIFSGLVDWPLASVFIAGGAIGGWVGAMLAKTQSAHKETLNTLFAMLVFTASIYILCKAAF